MLRNLDNHRGNIVFRGVPRHSEELFTAIEYDAETMPRGIEAYVLENPGDEMALKTGDVIQLGYKMTEPTSKQAVGTSFPIFARVSLTVTAESRRDSIEPARRDSILLIQPNLFM
ncbi:hypothetical protein CONPUDRAFT_83138 [Coniophora puteana RWD-64-598 SS2]|uniref:Uncharacterized protein n=1 Tax=Coniophora puteana (strain RWD-64-598) TaxID=741705 RepID=A0A5M3MKY8_CONPW|nr:uncharacterized protein CONPUDRAFT_83138 [Coniophora puteana RWD-64-598 SS2]EIW79892.1 hypothetical protein CONPUDRAFT_83138 [Coniophora puteana RWD-64-598 SS2]